MTIYILQYITVIVNFKLPQISDILHMSKDLFFTLHSAHVFPLTEIRGRPKLCLSLYSLVMYMMGHTSKPDKTPLYHQGKLTFLAGADIHFFIFQLLIIPYFLFYHHSKNHTFYIYQTTFSKNIAFAKALCIEKGFCPASGIPLRGS